MYLFTLEHSKTAYQTDAVLYSVAVVALASLLLLAGPRGPWLKERKRWHALHHRRGEWPAYYGVTTSFWDHVFGSVPGRATDFDLR